MNEVGKISTIMVYKTPIFSIRKNITLLYDCSLLTVSHHRTYQVIPSIIIFFQCSCFSCVFLVTGKRSKASPPLPTTLVVCYFAITTSRLRNIFLNFLTLGVGLSPPPHKNIIIYKWANSTGLLTLLSLDMQRFQ